uniref:CSON009074 protein n=1 Tax=Culicoides sonorensis TaxID=179676 RepID=A0A336M078_CULSO
MTEKLDLHSNEIVSIAEDSIYSLIKLRVLRMNSNKIIAIPENFLSMSFNLLRLDISYNKLDEILRNTFKGPKLLRSLHLDNNLIQCIHGSVFKELSELEILTLNNNSLSTIKEENLKGLAKLRTLRLSENPLHCNCDLIWFIKFLKRNLRLAPHARCQNPNSLVNKKINEISLDISNCAVQTKSFDTCKPRTTCSSPCKCNNGIVDCRKKSLTKIPNSFADSSIEMVLYGNKIKELPVNLFKGLTSLQLLLLNANAITCIKRDTFKDLRNLSLLSLYDNNIKTIFDGTLEPLLNIRTLHLAKNPFMCDCNLKWLSEYLHKNPIETSDRTASLAHQNCGVLFECPKDCFCYGSKIDCSQQNLTVISEEMPLITSDLLFEENLISVLHSDGFFGRLPNLQRLYLKNNLIKDIEPFAFEGAAKLEELYLDINKLSVIKNNMSLARNEITCMMPGSFDHFPQIFHVNLGENKFDCNCHVQWLAEWLKKRRILDPKAKCFQPEKLKGSSLLDLKPSSFVCFDGKDHGCLVNELEILSNFCLNV